jgi:beta-galactosidase
VRIPLWGVAVTTPTVDPRRSVAHVEVSVANLGASAANAEVRVTVRGGRTVDTVTTTFGIRSIVWNGKVGFQLNGQSVEIIGGNVHHDHGPMGAVALGRSEERRVEILKAAGFNSIRSAHNPPTPKFLDACDRLGMLVMDEFFDVWDTGKNPDDYSKFFAEWWERDLTGPRSATATTRAS